MAIELKQLQRSIRNFRIFAIIAIALVVGTYSLQFFGSLGYGLSSSSEAWGQFGDYVGGLLNPLLAYLAFYWLTQSTLIQKEELSLSLAALSKTASAQTDQAMLNARIAKLNALTVLVSNAQNQIDSIQSEIVYIMEQAKIEALVVFNRNGVPIDRKDVEKYIAQRRNELVQCEIDRLGCIVKIRQLVA